MKPHNRLQSADRDKSVDRTLQWGEWEETRPMTLATWDTFQSYLNKIPGSGYRDTNHRAPANLHYVVVDEEKNVVFRDLVPLPDRIPANIPYILGVAWMESNHSISTIYIASRMPGAGSAWRKRFDDWVFAHGGWRANPRNSEDETTENTNLDVDTETETDLDPDLDAEDNQQYQSDVDVDGAASDPVFLRALAIVNERAPKRKNSRSAGKRKRTTGEDSSVHPSSSSSTVQHSLSDLNDVSSSDTNIPIPNKFEYSLPSLRHSITNSVFGRHDRPRDDFEHEESLDELDRAKAAAEDAQGTLSREEENELEVWQGFGGHELDHEPKVAISGRQAQAQEFLEAWNEQTYYRFITGCLLNLNLAHSGKLYESL